MGKLNRIKEQKEPELESKQILHIKPRSQLFQGILKLKDKEFNERNIHKSKNSQEEYKPPL